MSYFNLVLDTRPPASPTLLVNGGAALTGSRDVQVELGTADFEGGAHDVEEMKLWGDVDPTADPLVQVLEADSDWQPFDVEYAVRLSTGAGLKTVNARLRDDVANETLVVCDSITLDPAATIVTVVSPVLIDRISKVSPSDLRAFGWQSSTAFDRYEVRVVPHIGSNHTQGYLISEAHGSINTNEDGSFPANTTITTTISGADLSAASPGDGSKVCKIFVRANGVWSV